VEIMTKYEVKLFKFKVEFDPLKKALKKHAVHIQEQCEKTRIIEFFTT
jgi:hypothetical protein